MDFLYYYYYKFIKQSTTLIKSSTLHGNGLFANQTFQPGETICSINDPRVRSMNDCAFVESELPSNSEFISHYNLLKDLNNVIKKDSFIVAARLIEKGDEITLSYGSHYWVYHLVLKQISYWEKSFLPYKDEINIEKIRELAENSVDRNFIFKVFINQLDYDLECQEYVAKANVKHFFNYS